MKVELLLSQQPVTETGGTFLTEFDLPDTDDMIALSKSVREYVDTHHRNFSIAGVLQPLALYEHCNKLVQDKLKRNGCYGAHVGVVGINDLLG